MQRDHFSILKDRKLTGRLTFQASIPAKITIIVVIEVQIWVYALSSNPDCFFEGS